MFVAARAARTGRRLRRELLDAGRRLRQPRSLRTARLVARRHRRQHHRRGLVPPAARRRHAPTKPTPTSGTARIYGYREHFADLRGRRFRGPGKPIHYVGRIASPGRPPQHARGASPPTSSARRRRPPSPTACRPSPVPIPEDLRSSFIDAVWRSLAWKRDHLARPAHRERADRSHRVPAGDRRRVRPDWIVETGTGDGARTLFLASICDLLGHGQVVSIGEDLSEDLPLHPRITYLDGVADDEATLDARAGPRRAGPDDAGRARQPRAPPRPRAGSSRRTRRSCASARTLIVTDTIVNGNPVWTGFGPGPNEAVKLAAATPW